MRVLLIHNRYQERGGEDAVAEAEAQLLESRGHHVIRLGVTNDLIPARRSLLDDLHLAASTVWSSSGAQIVADAIQSAEPDVVHFHNTFPLISPSGYNPAVQQGIPVVQTLHNYRLICPNAIFFRDGHVCEACLGWTPPWPGVMHACYRHSRSQTAVVASMLTFHRARGTWRHEVDRYIALTEFSRRKFIEGGLPASRISVKPNFLSPDPGVVEGQRTGFLYVGRLSSEKGAPTLLRAWAGLPSTIPIKIIGDGPLTPEAKAAATANPAVRPLGRLTRMHVLEQLQEAVALVFPSECYENFPVSIAEAFACGVPVIAANRGAAAEIVDHGRTGLLFTPGDACELATKAQWAWEHPNEMRRMGEAARREYATKYTAERNYEMLMDIYQQAIDSASVRRK